jgi:hypothetical protein
MVLPTRRLFVRPQLVSEQEIVPDIIHTNDQQLVLEWTRDRQLTLKVFPRAE